MPNKVTIFLESIADLYSLPPVAPLLLEEFLKSVDRNGVIHLSKWRKESIADSIGATLSTVNNALQILKSHNLITAKAVSVFELNKELFGEVFNNLYDGSWDVVENIELSITYSKKALLLAPRSLS